jgi:uncharacterized protein YprB with RNaseH-like and TPR domain
MPSLSDKLQSLGVKVGTQNLIAPKPKLCVDHPIDTVLAGDWWHTRHGDIFYVETRYPSDFRVGNTEIKPSFPLDIISTWALEPTISTLNLERFAFIDIETTGLSSGSGTFAFLIGAGRFERDEFRLVQFFLHDPSKELAQLAALEEFLSSCEAIVSFNGKSFDIPVIKTRFITNGWPPPLINVPHIDLLHLARRLWKARLPNRALGELEVKILGEKRSEQDVPGWMVPDLYFDYLHTGDARPLLGVFYHNEVDVVSLAALLNYMAGAISDPMSLPVELSLDVISIGKLYADLGFLDKAAKIYQHGLTLGNISDNDYWLAIKQLSFINKKMGNISSAMKYWELAARNGQIYAHIELAKIFEHRKKDFQAALKWTQIALEIISRDQSVINQEQWFEALKHRKNRLERKLLRSLDEK